MSHADLEPKNPEALREQVRTIREKGEHALPYVAFLALSARHPIYADKGHAWRREPFSEIKDEGTQNWIVCPRTEWKEYFPQEVANLCRDIGFNGLYVDWTFPYRCDAAHHGCGSTDARGLRRGEFGVFALRELAQSTYEQVKAVDPSARILLHTSGALMYSYIGFADLMINGEQLRQPLREAQGRYLDVLPLHVLRAEYRGTHAGLAPFLIPELATPEGLPDPALTAEPGPTNELLALALLHDIGIWPIYCHLETVEAVRRAQRNFFTGDVKFQPYWEGGGPLKVNDPALLTSGWIGREKLLAVLANLGETPVEAQVRIAPALPGGTLASAVDALSGESLEFDGRSLQLRVPSRSFRPIELKTENFD